MLKEECRVARIKYVLKAIKNTELMLDQFRFQEEWLYENS